MRAATARALLAELQGVKKALKEATEAKASSMASETAWKKEVRDLKEAMEQAEREKAALRKDLTHARELLKRQAMCEKTLRRDLALVRRELHEETGARLAQEVEHLTPAQRRLHENLLS